MQRPALLIDAVRRNARLRARVLAIAALTGCAPALSDPGSPTMTTTDAGGRVDAGHGDGMAPDHDDSTPDAIGGEDGTASDGPAGEAPSGISSADLVGHWSGTTSQSKAIGFTVDTGLVGWELGWQLPACGGTVTGSFPPVPIVDATVMRSLTAGPGGVSVTMTIWFSSPTDANGSVAFTVIPNAGGCGGSATATFSAHRDG
jgi:hypothetical protein